MAITTDCRTPKTTRPAFPLWRFISKTGDLDQLATLTKLNGSTLVQKLTYGYDRLGERTKVTDQNNVATNLGYARWETMELGDIQRHSAN
jgi:hypothetical protein